MTVVDDVSKWLSTAFYNVLSWLTGAEKRLSPALRIAEDFVNGFKNFEASPTGQTIEGLIETVVPASTGLINAFHLRLQQWFVSSRLVVAQVEGEIVKPLNEQAADAITKLNEIKALDFDQYSGDLNTLKALTTKFFASNMGDQGVITMPQALLLAPPSHDPDLTKVA